MKTEQLYPIWLLLYGLYTATPALAVQATKCIDHTKFSLIANDDFTADLSQWTLEGQDSQTQFHVVGGKAQLIAPAGATLWFNQAFSGNYQIELEATPIPYFEAKGDVRISDFNLFWNAQEIAGQPDPRQAKRQGALANYNNLQLYYLGFGANYNKTTRLRRYDGSEERPLLDGYAQASEKLPGDRSGEMNASTQLEEAKPVRMIVISKKNTHSNQKNLWVYANDALIFSYSDAKPLQQGWFAFRTTTSRFQLNAFKVFQCE